MLDLRTHLDALTDDELLELMHLTRRCQAALRKVMRPDGFNIGANLGRVAVGTLGVAGGDVRAFVQRVLNNVRGLARGDVKLR